MPRGVSFFSEYAAQRLLGRERGRALLGLGFVRRLLETLECCSSLLFEQDRQ